VRVAEAVVGAAVGALIAVVAAGCSPEGGDGASGRTSDGARPTTSATSPTTSAAVIPSSTAPATSARPARSRALDQPLIRAARRGEADRVRDLLSRGASVRARDDRGRTALVAAAYENNVRVAGVLVEAGADVNHKDDTVQSAYLIATSEVGDDTRLLDLTLAAGGDVRSLDSFHGTGLIRAADRGYPRVVRRLLATDIRVDHVNELGWTALHEAVILGDGSRRYVRVVRLLVDAGADVNKPSRRDGVRPLQHATSRGYVEVADVLRAAGAR
jgi:ankyrin repeat protein